MPAIKDFCMIRLSTFIRILLAGVWTAFFFIGAADAYTAQSSSYRLTASIINSGGGVSYSRNYQVFGSIGQSIAQAQFSESETYRLSSGFVACIGALYQPLPNPTSTSTSVPPSPGGGSPGGGGNGSPTTIATTIPTTSSTTTTIISGGGNGGSGGGGSGSTTSTSTVPQPPPESTTTTTTQPLCVVERLLTDEHKEEIETLRAFKDTRLSRSPAGIGLVSLYYLHSREIANILDRQPELRAEVRQVVLDLAAIAKPAMRSDGEIVLSARQRAAIEPLLLTIRSEASPGLQQSIDYVLEKLGEGSLLKQIGVVVK